MSPPHDPLPPRVPKSTARYKVAATESSFRIVQTACARVISDAVGLLRLRKKFSSCSLTLSLRIGTEIVFVVSPGANVSAPLVEVKSEPANAVPLAVAKSTEIGTFQAVERETAKTASLVPLVPSAVSTSSMERVGADAGVN